MRGAHDRNRTGEPLPYQGSALPTELRGRSCAIPATSKIPHGCFQDPNHLIIGAGDEARTRDIQLGRLKLYQLSYSRIYLINLKDSEPHPYTFVVLPRPVISAIFAAIIHMLEAM
jgi:hypothetical protein